MTRPPDRRSFRPLWTGLVAGVALAIGSTAAAQPARYSYIDLGTLGGPSSQAMGMNDMGMVVGWADRSARTGDSHAFLWDGRMHDLGALGDWSEARDVNAQGVVVGLSEAGRGEVHAFVSFGGVMHDLNGLLGSQIVVDGQNECSAPLRVLFEANAIGDDGLIVGCGFAWADDQPHAYLLVPRSELGGFALRYAYVDLGRLPEADDCVALDVNAAGEVVGRSGDQAFRWADGVFTPLEGGFASEARGLNRFGVAVGWTLDRTGHRAAIWNEGKPLSLDTPTGWASEAFRINDAGQVVGWVQDRVMPPALPPAASVWINGAPLDLNAVTSIPMLPELAGIRLERADDIDAAGRIVGFGRLPLGEIRAFLLEPLAQDE